MLEILGILSFSVAVMGFGSAAYLDLKTTEFPDWLPYSIIVAALGIRAVFSFMLGDFSILLNSIILGVIFLAFGLLLYYLKQWGDGDAWLLGGMGFLFPDANGFALRSTMQFPVTLMFNFFVISFFYLITYSIVIGIKSQGLPKKFFKDIKKEMKGIAKIVGSFTAATIAIMLYMIYYMGANMIAVLYVSLFPVMLFLILVFVRYGKFIENVVFKRKIKVDKLRVGDVPADEKWKVLSEKEIEELKKKGGEIWIKEGVRFSPVFIITIIVTLLYGSILFLF